MLARIANSLLWMGRYLERAQHTARYINVHYFSTLDAPILSKKEFLLESISSMTGLLYEYKDQALGLKEEEMIFRLILDDSNPVSIKSTILHARENARGARDILSSELWQSINKFYHHLNQFSRKILTPEEIIEFTEAVVNHCAVVNGYIDHSLIHDGTWSLIRLGIHVEASAQLTRILIAKIKDIKKVEKQNLGHEVANYQCVTLLKSAEAFDMSRILYKKVPNLKDSLEFLILNKHFPRSILFNLVEVQKCIDEIIVQNTEEKQSPNFLIGKSNAHLKYLTVEEIMPNIQTFLEKTLIEIYNLSHLIEKKIS